MSQRKARTSLNPPPPPSSSAPSGRPGEGATLSQIQQFEDFRRRHAKQNREIVSENINRKAMIKDLQDQVSQMQNELLEVHRVNAILRGQLKRMRRDQQRVMGAPTQQALDQILSAVPALRMLRDTLLSSSPTRPSTSSRPKSASVRLSRRENPVATRPAAAQAASAGLGALTEGSDCGSESDVESQVVVVLPVPSSPTVSAPGIRITRYIREATASVSPASSSSPSPRKVLVHKAKPNSPTPRVQKLAGQKRRRESGMLAAGTTTTALVVPPAAEEGETSWDEGAGVTISPEDAAELTSDNGEASSSEPSPALLAPRANPAPPPAPISKTVAGRAVARSRISFTPIVRSKDVKVAHPTLLLPIEAPKPDVTNTVGEAEEGVSGVIGALAKPRSIEHLDAVAEEASTETSAASSRPSTSSAAAFLFSPASSVATLVDDDGRNRRSRRSVSVNYKEPSLNKKMRKPDGVAVDEALGVKSRQSLALLDRPSPFSPSSSSSLPSLPSSSLSSLSSRPVPASANPPTSLTAALSSVVSAAPPPAVSRSTVPAASGVRRKSILPKTSIKGDQGGRGDESEDEGDDELPRDDEEDVISVREEKGKGRERAVQNGSTGTMEVIGSKSVTRTVSPPTTGLPSTSLSTITAPTASSRAKTGPRPSTRPALPSSIAAWDAFKAPAKAGTTTSAGAGGITGRSALVDIADNKVTQVIKGTRDAESILEKRGTMGQVGVETGVAARRARRSMAV